MELQPSRACLDKNHVDNLGVFGIDDAVGIQLALKDKLRFRLAKPGAHAMRYTNLRCMFHSPGFHDTQHFLVSRQGTTDCATSCATRANAYGLGTNILVTPSVHSFSEKQSESSSGSENPIF